MHRNTGLFALSRSVWQVLFIEAFGKEGMFMASSCQFFLLRQTQVQFKVNDVKQDYAMKLGDGGEAFFVFESSAEIPEDMQTSPLISPASSPQTRPSTPATSLGLDSEPLDLTSSTPPNKDVEENRMSLQNDGSYAGKGRLKIFGFEVMPDRYLQINEPPIFREVPVVFCDPVFRLLPVQMLATGTLNMLIQTMRYRP